MFSQHAVIVNKESGRKFRVLSTPDRTRISTHYTIGGMEGITKKAPCYGLQPTEPEGHTVYIEQPEVEQNFELSSAA